MVPADQVRGHPEAIEAEREVGVEEVPKATVTSPEEIAEEAILGAMISDREIAKQASIDVRDQWFLKGTNRLIFSVLTALIPEDPAVWPDTTRLLEELTEKRCPTPAARVADLMARGSSYGQQHIDYMVRGYRRRALAHALNEAQERLELTPDSPDEVSASAIEELRRVEDTMKPRTLRAAAMTLRNFMKSDIPKPAPILGGGVMTPGGFSLFVGQSGLGKTFASFHLACAIGSGAPWFGIPTAQQRVGILSLEIPDYSAQDRMEAILPHFPDGALDNVEIIRTDFAGYLWDIGNQTRYNELREWIVSSRLGLVILDPMNRIHTVDESKAAEIGPAVLNRIHEIRHETGCAVLLNHHEPKPPPGVKINDLQASRGSGRLHNDAQCMMRILEVEGHLCLRFPKVSLTEKPEPIWLYRDDNGALRRTEQPESKKATMTDNIELIRETMENEPDRFWSIGNLKATIPSIDKLTHRTVRRYLQQIGAHKIGTAKDPRYKIYQEPGG